MKFLSRVINNWFNLPYTDVCIAQHILRAFWVSVKNFTGDSTSCLLVQTSTSWPPSLPDDDWLARILYSSGFRNIHYSNKLKEHFDIMIFIERYPLKRCQGCVKLIASKVNCFLNINDSSEVQLCMSSNSWTWECPHTKDGADHVPLIFFSSV